MEDANRVEVLINSLDRSIKELRRAPYHGTEAIWPVRKVIDSLYNTVRELESFESKSAITTLLNVLKVTDKRSIKERFWTTEAKWAGQRAIHALMKIRGDESIEGLSGCLDLKNLELRLSVAHALANCENDIAASALENHRLHTKYDESTGELSLPVLKVNEKAEPVEIKRITIKKECVWCEQLKNPEFFNPRYSRGGGYCTLNNGPIALDSTCKSFQPNSRGSWWLQAFYMSAKYPQVRVWWKTV